MALIMRGFEDCALDDGTVVTGGQSAMKQFLIVRIVKKEDKKKYEEKKGVDFKSDEEKDECKMDVDES